MRAVLNTALSYLGSAGELTRARRSLRALAVLATTALAALTGPALAQQAIVQPGYAVVTGFGGYVANQPPSGADPTDYITDNLNGPSARVVDLTAMGSQGAVSNAPKPFTVFSQQVGQVFGVTLDDMQAPDFYLAATSAYGLSIAVPDAGGQLQRVHTGTPGAQFVPGQFGPQDQNGGPGSIWKVDGVTGQVSLFANVDGGTGSVAGLGALAYDPQSRQIFASERGTGIIYRIGLNGSVAGTYDHGSEGRPGAGLNPIPLVPSAPVSIQNPAFDTGNPQTWGVAALARRVYALAVHSQRLYYSVAQGPQIWSAPIGAGGAVSGSGARVEVDVPSLADGIEISSIAFDGQGNMYLAERGATSGDYSLTQLAAPGQSRVLRFVPKLPGDPNPGLWRLAPDEYAVGLPPAYDNANGGVALNYGYGPDGRINPAACSATVWSTGERLLDPGNGSTGFPTVDGLQGNDTSLVKPQNAPPTQAWYVDYDDQPGDPSFRGYMGAIATLPCGGQASSAPPPPVYCPAGTYFANGQCLVFPTCPAGTYFRDGVCLYPNCPPNTYRDRDNRCVPPPQSCPRDSFWYNGRCTPFCPPEMRRLPNGYCGCPDGTFYRDGRCVPPQFCPPRTHYDPRLQACVPDCRPDELYDPRNNRCIPHCPPFTQYDPRLDRCVPHCPPDQQFDPRQNKCIPHCPPNTNYDPRLNLCVPVCRDNQQYDPRLNRCVPHCPQDTTYNADLNRCVPHCPPNTQYDPRTNQCAPHCPPGVTVLPGCGPTPPVCQPGTQYNTDRRRCEPICNSDQRYDPQSNRCVLKCPPGITRLPGCGPTPPVCQPGTQYNTDRRRCEPICNSDQRYDSQANKCVPKCLPGILALPGCGPNQPGGQQGACDLQHFDKIGDRCLPKCGLDQTRDRRTLQCVTITLKPNPGLLPLQPQCSPREELLDGHCVLKCRLGTQRVNGVCTPIGGQNNQQGGGNNNFKPLLNDNVGPRNKLVCGPDQELLGNRCVQRCTGDEIRARNGACVRKP